MISRIAVLAVLALVLAAAVLVAARIPACRTPGRLPDGRTLLPNGWILSPVGRSVELDVGSLTLALSPDGTTVAALNCGASKHSVTLVDTASEKALRTIPVEHAWIGLDFHPTGTKLYVSGGNTGKLWEFSAEDGSPLREIVLRLGVFVSGVTAAPDGEFVYAGTVDTGEVFKVDLASGKVAATAHTAGNVYGIAVSADGGTVYVSDWLRARVLVYRAEDLSRVAEIPVGPHPAEMVLSGDGRLFVACAEDNSVYAIDARTRAVRERIRVCVHPHAPEGSAPASLCLSPDGTRLYVAVADNNCVAVVDVAEPEESRLLGFIPSGWYTSAVRAAGSKIMALASKGSRSRDNADRSYIGGLFKGELFFIDEPSPRELASYTRRVADNSPYRDQLLRGADKTMKSVLPARPGELSPIRYVIYIIKENRTYDQVFGDTPTGNGDPELCMYGEQITPNQHKLAREFVLLDNFYVDAEVSADGHNWSTAGYANDYVEKMWPYLYGGHGGEYDFEGQNPLSWPGGGYLWDACLRHGVTYRSFGEYVTKFGEGEGAWYEGTVPGLKGHVSRDFPEYDLKVADRTRFDVWLKEFREFEKAGEMPRLQIVRFGQNHTAGTRPGYWTPRAMVADNDLAVGKLVEAVSRSRFWPNTAILILEDDAQNGPDHVDAHRSVCLVASPYSRLGATDSNFYTTCSVLRTMELFLGVPPLNQYDAAAAPMFSVFRGRPDLRPFVAEAPRVDLDERNPQNAVMAAESLRMQLDVADAIEEDVMNRILWADAKGPNVPYPALNRTSIDLFRGRR